MNEDDSSTNVNDELANLTKSELNRLWLSRARGVLIKKYAIDELVDIYGLKLQRVAGGSQYCDIYYIENSEDRDKKYVYLDTLNLDRFATARQILQQILTYFPEDEDPPEEPDDTSDYPGPSPTFQ